MKQLMVVCMFLTGCASTGDVPGVKLGSVLWMNALCLFACSSHLSAARTETEGAATISQSSASGSPK